jgi:hypothetical protein
MREPLMMDFYINNLIVGNLGNPDGVNLFSILKKINNNFQAFNNMQVDHKCKENRKLMISALKEDFEKHSPNLMKNNTLILIFKSIN